MARLSYAHGVISGSALPFTEQLRNQKPFIIGHWSLELQLHPPHRGKHPPGRGSPGFSVYQTVPTVDLDKSFIVSGFQFLLLF